MRAVDETAQRGIVGRSKGGLYSGTAKSVKSAQTFGAKRKLEISVTHFRAARECRFFVVTRPVPKQAPIFGGGALRQETAHRGLAANFASVPAYARTHDTCGTKRTSCSIPPEPNIMLGKLVPVIRPLHEIASPTSSAAPDGTRTPRGAAGNGGTTGASRSAASAFASGARVAQREHEHELMSAARRDASSMPPLRKSKRLRSSLHTDPRPKKVPHLDPLPVKTEAVVAPAVNGVSASSPAIVSVVGSREVTATPTPVSLCSPDSSEAPVVSAGPPPAALAKGAATVKAAAELMMSEADFNKIVPVCEQEKIVWTKMKGHPFWPTQVVRLDSRLVREERFQDAFKFKRKGDDACVMYFGTCEVAWICLARSAISWEEGLKRGLHKVLTIRAAYQLALREVLGYCAKQTVYPRTWWCEPMCFELASDFIDRVSRDDFERKHRTTIDDAESERVCWARLRGYPHWPVQVLPLEVVLANYPELKFRAPPEGFAPTSWPCMFFGTGEVAMITERHITPMITGIQKRYWDASDRQDFIVSLGEMWGYLQKPRIWPSGYLSGRLWWNDNTTSSELANEAHEVPDRPKFEMIRRSVYSPSVSRPSTPDVDLVSCTCKPEAKDAPDTRYCRDDSCLNVASRFWCDPKTCPAGDRCDNQPFYKRKSPRLSIFYTADQRGWGLRLDESVQKGDFIVGYVGEILDRKTLQKRLDTKQRSGDMNYYIMDMHNDTFVDAEKKGNLSRFINSSCDPNCESQKWTEPAKGETHVGIFALKDIRAGTELTYDYSFKDYGFDNHKARSFFCRCRSANCRVMDPTERNWVAKVVCKRIKVRWDDGWYYGKVESYDSERKKFKVLYDDGDDEDLTLGLPTVPKNGDGIAFKLLDDEDKELKNV